MVCRRQLLSQRFVLNLAAFFQLCLYILLPVTDTDAEIIVHDMIALKGKPFMLVAETRGKFFPKGGEVVEFFIDDKSIGKNLSGGDGFTYKKFIPAKTGLHRVRAESDGDKGAGLLLCLEKGNSIVFIDVLGSVLDSLFSMKPKEKSQEVIKQISKRFPIVYLHTGVPGLGIMRKWLKENNFKEAPLILWEQGAIFDEIRQNGLKIKAVIGSPSVIESAKQYTPKAFSFDDVEGAEEVKDWKEIEKKITRP